MKKSLLQRLSTIFSMVVIVSLLLMSSANAASTTKSLATNFTLVNLADAGTPAATVSINYVKPDGSVWTGSTKTSFSIDPDGGQAIVRQYDDTLTAGQGSVVISSDQALGSMVQIQNRSGVGLPTSGAYTGFSSGSNIVNVPLISKNAMTANGISNAQIFVQNTGSASTTATIAFFTLGDASGTPIFTTPATTIAAGATWNYDLADESQANIPSASGWWGAAIVTAAAGGEVAVIVNWFLGADGLNSYEGVPSTTLASKWFIPLLYVRLPNSLTTSIIVQNNSGGSIPANDIQVTCTKDAGSGGNATLGPIENLADFPNRSTHTFNTFNDARFAQANWYGGCTVSSKTSKNIVVLVHHRYTNGSTADTGAYIAIPATSTDKTLYVPLVAKRLSNNFATTATIMNLSDVTDAVVTLTYTPAGGGAPIVRSGISIPKGTSIIRNFRLSTTESPELGDGWVGTMKVVSNTPIQAFLANTYLTLSGDQFMNYIGFTKP